MPGQAQAAPVGGQRRREPASRRGCRSRRSAAVQRDEVAQQVGIAPGRRQQQVAALARRAVAAFGARHVVGDGAHLGVGAGRAQAKAARAISGRSGQSSPIAATSGQSTPSAASTGAAATSFVAGAVDGVADAQIGDAAPHRSRIAPGDHHRRDAAARQQLEAVAVERAEGLEGLALLADVDAAIGEHAVDVEDRDAHALRREQELGRELQHRVEGASAMDGAVSRASGAVTRPLASAHPLVRFMATTLELVLLYPVAAVTGVVACRLARLPPCWATWWWAC